MIRRMSRRLSSDCRLRWSSCTGARRQLVLKGVDEPAAHENDHRLRPVTGHFESRTVIVDERAFDPAEAEAVRRPGKLIEERDRVVESVRKRSVPLYTLPPGQQKNDGSEEGCDRDERRKGEASRRPGNGDGRCADHQHRDRRIRPGAGAGNVLPGRDPLRRDVVRNDLRPQHDRQRERGGERDEKDLGHQMTLRTSLRFRTVRHCGRTSLCFFSRDPGRAVSRQERSARPSTSPMRAPNRLGAWLRRLLGKVLLRGAKEQLPAKPVRAHACALRAFLLYRMTGDVEAIAASADAVAEAAYLLGDYRMSRRFAAAAYRIYRRREDRRAASAILGVLAGVSRRLGRGVAALAYAQRSYELARETGDPTLLMLALGNLSQELTAWGRLEEAVESVILSIGLMEKHGRTRSRNYAVALNTLGLLFMQLNQDAIAKQYFERALVLADETGDAPMQSMLQSNLGLLCWRYREWDESLPRLRAALEIAHRIGDQPREGESSLNLARALIEIGQLEEAMPMLVRAFMVARRTDNRELECIVATAEARLFERQNRLDESARSAERAFSIAMSLGSDMARMAGMYSYARSCILLQELERAAELLEEVVRIEEVVSRELQTDALLTSVFDVQVSAYEDLQWVQVKLGRHTEALVSAERGRARVLARWMSERDAERDSPPDAGEIRRIAAELHTTFLVFSLVRDPVHLFEQEPESHAFIWAVPADPAEPVVFHCSPSLRDEWAHTARAPSSEMDPEVSDADLRTLHDWFIAPVAHALPSDSSTVVTVVPIGPLAVMPLAAAADADGRSLIERNPIAMTPSIQTLRLAMNRESRGEGALVVGDPGDDLEFARAEAELIAKGMAKRMATSTLIGSAATHDAVVRSMPGKRLLHFASHAEFDSADSASDHGVLKVSDGRDLTAHEIRAMPLDAELVVLSACVTGQGRIVADGVLGLARSFMLAGARTVIATLWEIPDMATLRLIEHFYERMAVHGRKARALQEAMLHVKRIPGYADPYHWAGFVLIGHHDAAGSLFPINETPTSFR